MNVHQNQRQIILFATGYYSLFLIVFTLKDVMRTHIFEMIRLCDLQEVLLLINIFIFSGTYLLS